MPIVLPDTLPLAKPSGGDKLNRVDFRWFVVRSLPRQERKLAGLFAKHKAAIPNILEVYCPMRTTVSVQKDGKDIEAPLFAGFVFVLSTRQAVATFMDRYYPDGTLMYDCGKGHGGNPVLLTIPEEQMRFFKDFNENYADKVVILERPYSDYAFNAKTDEPNEIVKVVDGPLAGKEGYFVRFRNGRRLVFRMKAPESGRYYAVSIPNVWNFHVVRLHNAEGDRQTLGTLKGRAVDLLAGILYGCGYGERTLPVLYGIIEALAVKPSLVELCRNLRKEGHGDLAVRISRLDGREAGLILELARHEHDNPGYVKTNWPRLVLRPFLTPTSGVEMEEGMSESELQHKDFTEIIRKVDITEDVYYPSRQEGAKVTTTYYAHIGMVEGKGGFTFFANWDGFLGEYFLTAGKANEKLVGGTVQSVRDDSLKPEKEKLIESFRNYAPTLYKVLADEKSSVKAIAGFKVGNETLNVMAVTATDVESGKDGLVRTCTDICKELSTTTHLAVWRRYLRTVWLHQ